MPSPCPCHVWEAAPAPKPSGADVLVSQDASKQHCWIQSHTSSQAPAHSREEQVTKPLLCLEHPYLCSIGAEKATYSPAWWSISWHPVLCYRSCSRLVQAGSCWSLAHPACPLLSW